MLNILERVNTDNVVKADIDLLNNVADQIQGKCLCPLGDFAAAPVLTSLKQFRADFDAHTTDGKKPPPKPPASGSAKPAPPKPSPKAAAEPAKAGD
jgi:NADH-quinone oxidoreductase subunit F